MPREKKDGKYLNTYISREIVELLDEYSKNTGVSKAFVVENALKGYINNCLTQGTPLLLNNASQQEGKE